MQKRDDLRKELLKSLEVRREYEKLRPEYELAKELIRARLAKKLTQQQLAQKIGVKQAYIARLESGAANPTFDTVNRVARALDKRVKLVGTAR